MTLRNVSLLLASFVMLGRGQEDLSGLKSPDWHVRAKTFGRILEDKKLLQETETQLAIVQCLEEEDSLLASGMAPDDESYGAIYLSKLGDTVFSIAKTTGNSQAETALLKSAYNPGSEVGLFLASHYTNLDELLRLAQSSSLGNRSSAIGVLGQMLEKSKSDGNRGLTDERYKEAKSRIINAASDQKENAIVRHTAVRSLGQIGDRSDVPLLQRLAVSDAASYKAMDGSIRFPVREEAIRGLQKMAK